MMRDKWNDRGYVALAFCLGGALWAMCGSPIVSAFSDVRVKVGLLIGFTGVGLLIAGTSLAVMIYCYHRANSAAD